MLDLMRRKKRLKFVLWLVIIGLGLSMMLLFVPGQNVGVAGFDSSAATVDGDPVPMKEFVDTYARIVQNYSAQGKNRTDPETLKMLGIPRQALDALINIRVISYAAKRLGVDVSPEEVRRAIETDPRLQDRGAFIGVERYKLLLSSSNISTTEFEEGIRFMAMQQKLRTIITDSLRVTEKEVRDEFARRNQEAQVRFVVLKRDDFAAKVTPTEPELRAYFDANKEKYRVKEQRRAQYLLISYNAVASNIQVSDKDVQEQWEREGRQETVDASHILLELKDAAKEAEVRAKAEEVLKKAKSGEDFAALAKKHSQDPGSAPQGGELGPFPRGRMTPEFERVAFALKPGEISDLVRTEFGFHIIKVNRHEIPNLEENRQSVVRAVQLNKASDVMKQKSAEAARIIEAGKEKDLSAIAKSLGIPAEIKETGFLSKDSDAYTAGVSPAFVEELFKLKEVNAVGKAAEHPLGAAIPKLVETRLPKPPEFNESKAAVAKDYVSQKAGELMMAEAKAASEEAAKSGDIEKAAQDRRLTVKTSANFKKDAAADPELSGAQAFNAAAFSLPVNGVSGPISLDSGARTAVLQVKSRTPFDEAEFKKQRADLSEGLLGAWKEAYFQDYVRRITEDLEKNGKIRINENALNQLPTVRY